MSKILRIIGWVNIAAGLVLALMFQSLKVSSAEIAGAIYAHEPIPAGLDSVTANLGSLSMLVGGVIGSLLFFAVARILDRVEEIHFAMGSPTEQLKRFK